MNLFEIPCDKRLLDNRISDIQRRNGLFRSYPFESWKLRIAYSRIDQNNPDFLLCICLEFFFAFIHLNFRKSFN